MVVSRGVACALLLCLVALAAACEEPVSVNGARALDPEPSWRALHDSVEACTGLSGDYDRITWFAVEKLVTTDGDAAGYWHSPHRIYLEIDGNRATDVPRIYWRSVVRHEMIHDLVQDGSHAAPAFRLCDRFH